MCAFKQLAVVAAYGQCGHWNGCSPVCVRMCTVSVESAANALPHSLHRCLFLSVIIPTLPVGSLASAMVVAHVAEGEEKEEKKKNTRPFRFWGGFFGDCCLRWAYIPHDRARVTASVPSFLYPFIGLLFIF
jgi:hypothetical protein